MSKMTNRQNRQKGCRQYSRRILSLLLFAFLLSACAEGSDRASDTGAVGPPLDISEENLRRIYAETEECAGLRGAGFDALLVEVRSERWPCERYQGGCIGEFNSPNKITIVGSNIFDHELVHYLLWFNKGDADPEHHSPLFSQCADPDMV